jgi:signal transduction histidine kinase
MGVEQLVHIQRAWQAATYMVVGHAVAREARHRPSLGGRDHSEIVTSRAWWAGWLALVNVIGWITLGDRGETSLALAAKATALAAGLVGVVCWIMAQRRRPLPQTWPLGLVLVGMAASAGFATATHDGIPILGLAVLAVFAAAVELPLVAAAAVLLAAVTGLEISLRMTPPGGGFAVWCPLVLLVTFVIGRNRAGARMRAAQAALLLAQADRLREEQRKVAILDERARIARELHDVVGNSLGALSLQIQAAHAILDDGGDIPGARRVLDRAQKLARDGLVETRRAISSLRSDGATLDRELAMIVQGHRELHGSPVTYRVVGKPGDVSPTTSLALCRAAQECLTNAAKHAEGQSVDLRLIYRARRVTLSVSNPLGPGPTAAPRLVTVGARVGLSGIRERLVLLGGRLEAVCKAGTWTVTADVPR